jgi:hypothetical protein
MPMYDKRNVDSQYGHDKETHTKNINKQLISFKYVTRQYSKRSTYNEGCNHVKNTKKNVTDVMRDTGLYAS